MYKIEKRFTVPIGHRLSKHKGLCANIHGHNLVILVGVKSAKLNENDMVIDFAELKKEVKEIIDRWDHTLFVNVSDDYNSLLVMKEDMRVRAIMGDPTAENLSKILFDELNFNLRRQYKINLDYVTIYENENSKVTYSE